jgi:hypothetical protein
MGCVKEEGNIRIFPGRKLISYLNLLGAILSEKRTPRSG